MNRSFVIFITVLTAAFSTAGYGNELREIRVVPYHNYDRIVFEIDQAAETEVTQPSDSTFEIRFKSVDVDPGFTLPMLTSKLGFLKSINAYRISSNDLVFEVWVKNTATARARFLGEAPWKYAVDLTAPGTVLPEPVVRSEQTQAAAPVKSEPAETQQEPVPEEPELNSEKQNPEAESEEKPEYIPGDRPFPTVYAEAEDATQEVIDPLKASAVLAYFFLSQGDEEKAVVHAERYLQLTGSELNLAGDRTAAGTLLAFPMAVYGWLLACAFVAGLVGGIAGSRVRFKWKLRLKKSAPRKPAEAAAEKAQEVVQDLEKLRKTVKQEKVEKIEEDVKDEEPEEPKPEAPPEAEAQAKDVLMDRRVKRVIELADSGRQIEDIAKELEMGQDEVKLILDLNK